MKTVVQRSFSRTIVLTKHRVSKRIYKKNFRRTFSHKSVCKILRQGRHLVKKVKMESPRIKNKLHKKI